MSATVVDRDDLTVWSCMCGTHVVVTGDRMVPDHFSPERCWCAISGCTLAPRILAACAA
jgi:hypothetical protein